MEYKELFEKLGNPNPICFANYKIIITADDIPKYNNKYDITFVPNIGGTTDADITEFKAFWVDIDAGKDENGNYFLRIVIDSEEGIDLDKCVEVTRLINPLLDDANIIEDGYTLEVWSKERGE